MTATPNDRHWSILDEANDIVHGPRRQAYGHPRDNFRRIVTLWNAWLDIRQPGALRNEDQAAMMILLKLARLAETPDHRDSLCDIAGYAATWEMLREDGAE